MSDCALGNIRHDLLCGLDTHDVCGVVEWSQILYGAECLKNFRCNDNALCKLVASMQNTVAYRLDYGHVFDYADFLVGDCLEDELNGLLVGWAGALDFGLVALCLVCDA